ncbi:unnamed protein product [Closterium sp. NIES-53]
MYALSVSAEGDCYLCVPPDPDIEAAALGASESALPDSLVAPPSAVPNSPMAPPPWLALPATPSWHSLPPPCLWSSQVSSSPPALACPALPSLRRGAVARRSSLLLVSSDDCSSVDSPHRRSVSSSASGSARTFLSCVCTLTEVCRIGLVMEVARTSMIHAAAPHFLWPFTVRNAAHPLNLWPRVSLPKNSPTQRWTGEVGDASVFWVWGSRAFVRDTSVDKIFARSIPCVFLGFPPDAPGWQFYHHTLRHVFLSQDIMFDESVPFYRPLLVHYRSAPPPPPPPILALDPLLGTVPVEVAVDSGKARGAASGGAEPEGAEPRGAEPGGAESEGARFGGAEPGGAQPAGVESGGAEPVGVEPGGAEFGGAEPRGPASSGGSADALPRLSPRPEPLSPQQLCGWLISLQSGAAGAGDSAARGAGVTFGAGGTGGAAAAGRGGARTRGTGAAGTGSVGGAGAGDPMEPGAAGAGGAGAGAGGAGGARAIGVGAVGAGARGTDAGGAGLGGAGAVDRGAGGAGAGGAGGTVRLQPYFVPLLQQVLGVPSSTGLTPALLCPSPDQWQPPLQPASRLHAPSPYTEQTGGLTERCEPASRPASPVCTGRCVPRSRPPPVPVTHAMAIRPSSVPLCVPLPLPPESPLPAVLDPESDCARAASPNVSRLLATVVTDTSFESIVASALVAELVDFAATCRLDYATTLIAKSEFASPPSVGGECALGTDVLEDRQEDFECLAAALPRFASMLLAPEGDPSAPDIPTPRSYAEAITGPYSSQWQAAMAAKMAFWKSTGTYVDAVPPSRANIVNGMWLFRVKRPPGSPPAFKARYVASGFSQRQGVDFFQTFSPILKMTTLRVLLHVAAQRDFKLHSLDFSTAFLQGSLHEEIRLRRPPSFTRSLPAGTQWSLQRPVYGLRQAPREWHDTLRTTLAAMGYAPSTTDPTLILRIDTSLPPFDVLVYVDDLVLATADTEALTLVKSELQKRHTCTDLAPPSDESIEPSGLYLELVGRLMYLMTCTRPDLVYPLSLLACYVAPVRRAWGSCLEDGVQMSSVVTQTLLGSSCEAEIYAGAMAAQELRWLAYLLSDLGEQPRSPPVLYVANKAMIALCQEHILEHRTKHIALRYFLARELQQHGQLRLAYVATRTKALPPGDHPRFSTVLGLGRAVDFEVWLDDLELFLQCDRADGLSLFDLTSGLSPAPPATADSTVRSQWATCDAAARLAVRRHLPTTERAHFSQYRSAQTLYDAVVARYSSPATAALSRLFLPYLFPDLAAFPTVADLITHLRTSDARYRTALPAEFCAKNPPPLYLTLYYVVTRLPDSLRVVRDHFLSVCPTTLTVDLHEERLLAAEQSIVAVGAYRGDPRTPIFEGCSPSPLLPSVASAATADLGGFESVGAASAPGGGRRPGRGKGGRGARWGGRGGGGGGGGSGGVGVVVVVVVVEVSAAAVEAVEAVAEAGVAEAVEVAEAAEAVVELVAELHRGVVPVVVSASSSSAVLRPPPLSIFVSGTLSVSAVEVLAPAPTFSVLETALFPDATEIPRWGDLSRAGVAVFDLDYDAILAAMYALSTSDEGDCYLCVPPDPGIEAAALGADETAALGASAFAAPGAGESAPSGTASAQVFHTFTLDSGASRSFFCDRTTLTSLSRPVAVSLADPSGGPVLASFSTVLPCLAAPSGSLSGLYLPSFSTNLVSGADLQDQGVDQFTRASQRVTHCTCARMGRHLATFTRRPGSSLYTMSTESPPVSASGQFYHPTSRRVLSSQDVTFDESVPYYRLFPYRTASLPPPPLFLAPGPPPVDPLPPQGPALSGVSQVDAVEPVEVAVDSGAAPGAEPAGAGFGGAESGGAETWGAEPGGAEPGGAEPGGAEPGGAATGGAGSARVASGGASSRREVLSPRELREWFARRWSRAAGAGGTPATTGSGGTGPGGAGATGPGGAAEAAGVGPAGGSAGVSGGTGAAGSAGPAAAGAPGVGAAGGVGAGVCTDAGVCADAELSEGAGAGAAVAGGAAGAGAPAGSRGAVPAGSGGAARPRPYFVPLLEQSQSLLQPVSPLPAPSPYTGPNGGLAERRAPASRPASPARPACTSRLTSRPRPRAVPGTHQMALRPSTAPLHVPLPSPPATSLPALPDPESGSLRAASPTVARFLATVVTDPSLASTAASALVAELVDFLVTFLRHGRPHTDPGVLLRLLITLLITFVPLVRCVPLCVRELRVVLEANTADIFTKALAPGDHQRFCTLLACFALLDWSCDPLFSPTLSMGVSQTYML